MELMDKLPVLVIGKKLYLRSSLEAEGRRMFRCFDTEEAQQAIKRLPPLSLKRVESDKFYFVKLAYWLDLPKSKPLRILDIGSFYGMWPYLCQAYGHDTICTDLPEMFDRIEVQEMQKILKVSSMALRIEAFKPVGDIGEYDLITGIRTRFHSVLPRESGLEKEQHWGVQEWAYFLKDIVTHIRPGGKLFFALNRLQSREEGGAIPIELKTFFCSNGAYLKGLFLRFDTVELLRSMSRIEKCDGIL